MGERARHPGYPARGRAVYSAALHHLAAAGRRQPQHPDHVHSDARKLRLGRQSGQAPRSRWVESVGDLSGHRMLAGRRAGHVHIL